MTIKDLTRNLQFINVRKKARKLFITFAILAISSISAWTQCPADPNNCAPPSGSVTSMDANIYSENDFKGDNQALQVQGAWGCVDLPDVRIKSASSTASTQLTFHYGKGCVGHVIKQVQGGFSNSTDDGLCAGSLFIKFNRYGSC